MAVAQRSYSREPKDDAFAHAAATAKVSGLITSDNALLCLHRLGDLQILTPCAGLDELLRITPRML